MANRGASRWRRILCSAGALLLCCLLVLVVLSRFDASKSPATRSQPPAPRRVGRDESKPEAGLSRSTNLEIAPSRVRLLLRCASSDGAVSATVQALDVESGRQIASVRTIEDDDAFSPVDLPIPGSACDFAPPTARSTAPKSTARLGSAPTAFSLQRPRVVSSRRPFRCRTLHGRRSNVDSKRFLESSARRHAGSLSSPEALSRTTSSCALRAPLGLPVVRTSRRLGLLGSLLTPSRRVHR